MKFTINREDGIIIENALQKYARKDETTDTERETICKIFKLLEQEEEITIEEAKLLETALMEYMSLDDIETTIYTAGIINRLRFSIKQTKCEIKTATTVDL